MTITNSFLYYRELRIAIEDRRGVLLLREVEKSIQQAQEESANEEVAES